MIRCWSKLENVQFAIWVAISFIVDFSYFIFQTYSYAGCKFNKCIVLQFNPAQIKGPYELFTNKLHKTYKFDDNKLSTK